MVHCPKCGKDNPENQRLCFWCGANLAGAEAPKSEVGEPEVPAQKPKPAPSTEKVEIPKPKSPAPPAEQNPPQELGAPKAPKGPRVKLVVLVIAVVLVLVAALYVFQWGGIWAGAGGTSFSNAILITDTASGSLARDQEVYYKFWMGDNQRAIVAFDLPKRADLHLYDSRLAGVERRAEADQFLIDSETFGGTGSLIATGSSGYYYACISDVTTSGSYTLSVSEVPAPSPASQGGTFSDAITVSDSVTGNLDHNQHIYYKFWVDSGKNFTVGGGGTWNHFIVHRPDQSQKGSFEGG